MEVQWEALWSVDVQRDESPRRNGDGALMERDALRRGLPGMVMAARVMREMRGLVERLWICTGMDGETWYEIAGRWRRGREGEGDGSSMHGERYGNRQKGFKEREKVESPEIWDSNSHFSWTPLPYPDGGPRGGSGLGLGQVKVRLDGLNGSGI
ncbi:hypothetical protein AAC387_Pa05g1399 [Persea americana]